MIKITFEWAVAGFCISSIFLVIVFWIFYNYVKSPELSAPQGEALQQCPICMHVFFNYQKTEIITCPLCKSLIQAQAASQTGKGEGPPC